MITEFLKYTHFHLLLFLIYRKISFISLSCGNYVKVMLEYNPKKKHGSKYANEKAKRSNTKIWLGV